MQADRGFIENVQHADQSRADLGRQTNPLRLAAGERRRRPAESQIIESDIAQEPEPLPDLFENLPGDCLLTVASD